MQRYKIILNPPLLFVIYFVPLPYHGAKGQQSQTMGWREEAIYEATF
jgi:hypothetical protein